MDLNDIDPEDIESAFEGLAGTEEMLTETAADASGGAGITSHGEKVTGVSGDE